MAKQAPKVCVYAICKNEIKNLDAWLESMAPADYIVVLDTGSTDGSFEKLKKDSRVHKVEQKIIDPWRFDVARNESMKLIPSDTAICVCTDPDERFSSATWANMLRAHWILGKKAIRAEYTYAWSHTENGDPTNIFMCNKIHSYGDYHWVYPCHEVLRLNDDITEPEQTIEFGDGIYLHHYQDTTKDRTNYLELLRIAAEETGSIYNKMLYARELSIRKNPQQSLSVYFEVLGSEDIDLPENKLVLLDSLLNVSTIYFNDLRSLPDSIWYAEEFINVDPTYREPYLILAQAYIDKQLFTIAEGYIEAAKKYGYQHNNWVEHSTAYVGWLEDLELQVKNGLTKFKLSGKLNKDAKWFE